STGQPLAATASNFTRAMPFALALSVATASGSHLEWRGALLAAVSGALTSGIAYSFWYAALPGLTGTQAAIVQLAVPALAAAPVGATSAPPRPDPMSLPVATTAQAPLAAAYNSLDVPSLTAGQSYLDPTTRVKTYKLTSATFPAPSPNWSHDYAEGGDEVSLPYNGNTRAVFVRQDSTSGGPWWLIDFTPGAGVGNPRPLTGNLAPWIDLAFTFSNNPATPYYVYVSTGGTIYRFDIRTMTAAPGNGWPLTGETGVYWLHQSENDGL